MYFLIVFLFALCVSLHTKYIMYFFVPFVLLFVPFVTLASKGLNCYEEKHKVHKVIFIMF